MELKYLARRRRGRVNNRDKTRHRTDSRELPGHVISTNNKTRISSHRVVVALAADRLGQMFVLALPNKPHPPPAAAAFKQFQVSCRAFIRRGISCPVGATDDVVSRSGWRAEERGWREGGDSVTDWLTLKPDWRQYNFPFDNPFASVKFFSSSTCLPPIRLPLCQWYVMAGD